MKKQSFIYVGAAAELLSKGVDVSKLSREQFVTHESLKGSEFIIKIDEETKKFFELNSLFIKRSDTQYPQYNGLLEDTDKLEPNLSLTFEYVKEIMKVLYTTDIEYFSDFDEESFIDDYKELISNLDKDWEKPVLEMQEKLTRDNTDMALKIFLALFDYKNGVSKEIYDDSKLDKKPALTYKKGTDFDIIDNRLYIYIKPSDKNKIRKCMQSQGCRNFSLVNDIKAFVISKNVYDYFWASYGNKFQSCFSLSSDYFHLYGYIPFSMAEESFICYATTGGVNKIPIVAGNQFQCPNMLFRCWGYASEDKELLLDKRYGLNDSNDGFRFFQALRDVLAKKISVNTTSDNEDTISLLNGGKGIFDIFERTDGQFYSDSLKIRDEDVVFKYSCGTNTTGHQEYPWKSSYTKFTDYASTITSVSDTLTLDKLYKVVNGRLMNPKLCEKTGFFIEENENESIYAKFYTKPCKKSCVLTYIGGSVFCDMTTTDNVNNSYLNINMLSGYRDFKSGKLYTAGYHTPSGCNSRTLTLKSLKEFLKGHVKDMSFDGILLRYFEGSEVRYQFYKG